MINKSGAPLGKIDCHGKTAKHPTESGNTDQFVVAAVKPSLQILESSLAIDDPSRLFGGTHGLLLVVADGLGERNCGERASTVAVDAVTKYLINSFDVQHDLNEIREQQLLNDLKQSLVDCRNQMKREVAAGDRFQEMATTLTMIYVVWPRAFVVHVGSNRAYHVNGGSMAQLTTDHSMASRLHESSIIGGRRVLPSPMSNDLWNVVGTQDVECSPDTAVVDLEIGDTLVLCSDGVVKGTTDGKLLGAVNESQTARETCERVFSALDQQVDDATVVVARFLAPDDASVLDSEVAAKSVSESKPDTVTAPHSLKQ